MIVDVNIVFANLTELKTPVGIITIDGLNEHIPFDLVQGTFSSDYEIYAEATKNILLR